MLSQVQIILVDSYRLVTCGDVADATRASIDVLVITEVNVCYVVWVEKRVW